MCFASVTLPAHCSQVLQTVERMKRRAAAKNRKADDMDSGEDLIQMLLKEQQRQLEQDTAVAQVPWHAAGITGTTSLRVGSKDLFIDAEIRIRPGRRYGLVGANGTGKTTILRHLAAHAIPNVQVPYDARIIHVNQEVPGEQRSAIAVVIASDVRRTKLLQDEADCMAALEELERAEAFAAAMAKEAAAAAEATQAAAPETGAAAAAPAEGVSVPSEAAAGGVGAAAAAPAGAEAGHTSATGAVDSGPAADPQGGASGDPDGGDGDGQGKGDGAGGTGGHLSRFKGAAHFAEVKSRSKGDASKSKRKKTSAELQAVYTQIQAALTDIDAFTAESRAAEILSGLQFSQSMMTMSTEQLSGGWRMRVALACGLFATPDILCCDESTVHLDFAAVEWLQSYLCEHYGSASSPTKSIVVVSHDRAFLNGLATDIMHLANHKLEYYRGNYDSFDKQRVERAKEAARQAEAHAAKIAHMQSFVDKFRASAARASQAQSRVKAIEKLRREGAGGAAASAAAAATGVGLGGTGVRLHFPDPGPLGTPVLQIKDVSFGYKEVAEGSTDDEAAGTISLLFQNVSFGVDMSSRIAILGPNGVGKSTLLKLISGELEAREGQIDRNSHLRIAKFDQHHMEGMDPEATPLSWLQTKHPEGTRGMNETELRSWLGKYGLSGMLATQQIKVLSGGQKSRVSIATMLFSKPHIVLLDEPSNFLDIDAVDALIEGIKEFAGGVVMVSHDEHLIDNVATTLLVAGYPYPGAITRYRGTLAKYRKEVEGLSRVDMSRMHDHEGGDIADEAELGALTKGTAAETPAVAAASSSGGR